MRDWGELSGKAEKANMSAAEIKAALPIAYVLYVQDVVAEQRDDGKLYAVCPFHADTNPSFEVYGEDLSKWNCPPCGIGGDVFDLIGRFTGSESFTEQRETAVVILSDLETSEWSGPTEGQPKRQLDEDYMRRVVLGAQPGDLTDEFATAKQFEFDAEWLFERFGVGDYGSWIVIPYRSNDGELVTYKHRTATTKPEAAAGSKFDGIFYAEWLDDGTKPILLCESESDVWAATHAVGDHYTVLGLPTGAGSKPKQIDRLGNNRQVVVAFDGDASGRSANRRWWAALTTAGFDVLVAALPDGLDLATPGIDIARIVDTARPISRAPDGLRAEDHGYVKPGEKTNLPITNWTFTPERELRGTSGQAYEGFILPGRRPAILSSFDLSQKAKLVAWSTRNGGSFYGSDRDGQLLLGQLQAEGPFLSTGHMASVAGLHQGHFVYPGGTIGPDYWQYVAPSADVHLENNLRLSPGEWAPEQVPALLRLHKPAVMHPLLAWLAAAPVRSLLREFPILAVTGSSGSGKTTLLETLLPAFTGSLITNNLTSTTKHALFAYIGSTNAFPVHFDEYRPGARKDTLLALQQLLRDAYTGQPSSKGGMGEHWAEVVSVDTMAPVVVSGEDAFTETSHTERMVLVSLPLAGRNPDVLGQVRGWGETGLAHAYLSWIQESLADGTLPAIVNRSTGPEDLPPRAQLNLGVLELGWSLLSRFMQQYNIDLGDPDFSLVIAESREAARHSPIEDALMWAVGEIDCGSFIFYEGDSLCVRMENFVNFIQTKSVFTLPGGVTAVRKYLVNKYGAEDGSVRRYDGTREMLKIPRDAFSPQ